MKDNRIANGTEFHSFTESNPNGPRPCFDRQCSTELSAWKEVAEYRFEGRWTNDPCEIVNQFGNTVWSYTCET